LWHDLRTLVSRVELDLGQHRWGSLQTDCNKSIGGGQLQGILKKQTKSLFETTSVQIEHNGG